MTTATGAPVLADLPVGRTAEWTFSVSDADMDTFAALSGDHSPLHTDEAFAVARGYEGRLVHGALLSAQLSRLVGMEMPGPNGMTVGFTMSFPKPVYVDRPVTVRAEIIEASEAASMIVMKVQMRSDDRLVAKGRVEAIVRA